MTRLVRVRVDGELHVDRAPLTDYQLSAIVAATTITREVHGTFETIKLARFDGETITMPRGATGLLRTALGSGIAWDDERASVSRTFRGHLPWRPHQVELAQILFEREQGTGLGATGSGKTATVLACIERLGQRSLILASTIDLARQWQREATTYLGVDAAVCTDGKWENGNVVISTPETAQKHLDKIRGAFGFLAVDECQNFATVRRVALVGRIDAKYRLALSATLPADYRARILQITYGAVLHRFTVADSMAAGFVVAPEYVAIRTSFDFRYTGPDDWHALVTALVADEQRNELIVRSVVEQCAGICVLVLSVRKAHLATLADMFAARGLRVGILTGDVAKMKREQTLEDARAGKLDAILGSVVADEGINIPNLGAVALAFPGRSELRLLQRIGRCVRATPQKPTPIVLDFTDRVGPLANQARVRASVFARTFEGRAS